ncbi:MAG: hypothetical protein Q4E13_12750 [Clostridia bacterium]|nr:hypothetical protein [Clostridia bacterium]
MTRIEDREVHILEWIRELATALCAIAAMSALSEVLLAGRKGSQAVSLLLSLAGVGAILSRIARLIEKTN